MGSPEPPLHPLTGLPMAECPECGRLSGVSGIDGRKCLSCSSVPPDGTRQEFELDEARTHAIEWKRAYFAERERVNQLEAAVKIREEECDEADARVNQLEQDLTDAEESIAHLAGLLDQLEQAATLPDGIGHWLNGTVHWFDPLSSPVRGCPMCEALSATGEDAK